MTTTYSLTLHLTTFYTSLFDESFAKTPESGGLSDCHKEKRKEKTIGSYISMELSPVLDFPWNFRILIWISCILMSGFPHILIWISLDHSVDYPFCSIVFY